MLILTRKPGEKVVIGSGITVTMVEVKGGRVRLGFEATDQVRILRAELACWQDDPQGADPEGERDWSQAAENDPELELAGR
jgi:carbon storage regulator